MQGPEHRPDGCWGIDGGWRCVIVRAIYPGSFDPATEGHLDVARRGAGLFDELVVAIGINPSKTGRFPVIDRVRVLESALHDLFNVSVATFSGLLVTYCRDNEIDLILPEFATKATIGMRFRWLT